MFIFLAALFVAAGLVHGAVKHAGKVERIDLVLVYLLAGYHGIVMVAVALFGMIHPARAAAMLGAPAGNVFQDFMAWAYLGMSVASILAIWLRGSYLAGPVVYWSIYFLGATRVHMSQL
ncbi:MAG TPA: DUF6790 family protein, partial [Candidatus Saccharimonadales bacterium]|nr:DUF6790 family protein [Candidatus Saccharimonadales bacterium]